jgi:hypothetical protein
VPVLRATVLAPTRKALAGRGVVVAARLRRRRVGLVDGFGLADGI